MTTSHEVSLTHRTAYRLADLTSHLPAGRSDDQREAAFLPCDGYRLAVFSI